MPTRLRVGMGFSLIAVLQSTFFGKLRSKADSSQAQNDGLLFLCVGVGTWF